MAVARASYAPRYPLPVVGLCPLSAALSLLVTLVFAGVQSRRVVTTVLFVCISRLMLAEKLGGATIRDWDHCQVGRVS